MRATTPLPRREASRLSAGLALGLGLEAHARRAAASVCAGPPPLALVFADEGFYPTGYNIGDLAKAYQKVTGDVTLLDMKAGEALQAQGQGPPWWLFAKEPSDLPPYLIPLDAGLRTANFDPSVLVPGVLESFQNTAGAYAMPHALSAERRWYQPAAFMQAGVDLPAPDWTVDDFAATCAGSQKGLDTGGVDGVIAVLPPSSGATTYAVQGQPVTFRPGLYLSAAQWISGYGGAWAMPARPRT